MDKKSAEKKKTKKKKISTTHQFRAQINCQCNRNCAELIDVVNQKEIFDQFYGCKSWSEKTMYLRSIAKQEPVKENFNPRINFKNKDFSSIFCLSDADGKTVRVCAAFVIKLLKINRTKLFRAASSVKNNPFAVDRRGKASKRQTSAADTQIVKQFIQSIPNYESKIDSNSFDIKYLNPNLTVNGVYGLYGNMCEFQQKQKLSKTVFVKIFKTYFPRLQPYKAEKSQCSVCQSIKEKKKVKVLSPAVLERIEQQENDHFTELREFKNEFLSGIIEPEVGVEIFAFELQRPFQMPMLPIDESYDLRCLWFSNLCIFDELN